MGNRFCEWCCERIRSDADEYTEAGIYWHKWCVDDARDFGQMPDDDDPDPHAWVEDSSWADDAA